GGRRIAAGLSLPGGRDRLQFSKHAGPVPAGRPGERRARGRGSVVEHHLAKVRVAGSNPVVRSEWPEVISGWPRAIRGGMAEWFRQGPAKPCTRVRFPLPPRGRLAQRESASLTRKRSQVQILYRPPVPQVSGQFPDPGGWPEDHLSSV